MMAAEKPRKKVPVSASALIQRINRALEKDQQKLRATRPGTRAEMDLGRFYIHEMSRNSVTAQHVDLEDLGRELEVLQEWETMVEDD